MKSSGNIPLLEGSASETVSKPARTRRSASLQDPRSQSSLVFGGTQSFASAVQRSFETDASALPRLILKPTCSRAAFSLIELLASLAVLLIIIGILAMIYIHFDKAWTQGTGKAESSTTGQVALNLIRRDMEQAVADDLLTFATQPDRSNMTSYGFANDEICFVSMEGTNFVGAATNRTALEVQYWVRDIGGRYELVRSCLTNDIGLPTNSLANCYWNTNWYKDASQGGAGRSASNAAIVAENVAGLSFIASGATGDVYESSAYSNRLPEYVDVCLELLDEVSAKQAAQLWGMNAANKQDFVERKIRRYTTRVFFENRSGYRIR